MSPLGIEIALHYYCSDDIWKGGVFSPADEAIHQALISAGLLVKEHDRYRASRPAMNVYADALCQVRLPVKVVRWEIPE